MPEAPAPTVPPVPPTNPGSPSSGGRPSGRPKNIPQFAFLVEFSGSRNENVMCPIDQHVCRGRWSRKNLVRTGAQIEGEFNSMPDLPGLCLLVNTAKRIIRRFDPLGDPENAKLLKRAQRVGLAVLGTKYTPEKTKTWKERSADDNTIKSFCYWVLRLRDAGHITVVKGRIPEWDEIRQLPGVIQLGTFDTKAMAVRGVPDDAIRYVKPVPDEVEEGLSEEFMDEIPDPVINSDGMGFADDDRDEDDGE